MFSCTCGDTFQKQGEALAQENVYDRDRECYFLALWTYLIYQCPGCSEWKVEIEERELAAFEEVMGDDAIPWED